MQKHIREINNKKDELVFQRIIERVVRAGLIHEPLDVTKESKKIFPRLKRIVHEIDNSEHYYWNDGTDDGLLLISFFPTNNFDATHNIFETKINYK